MTMTAEMISKIEALPESDMSIVFGLVDQLSRKPVDYFEALRRDGQKNPMTEDEVDDFVASVRRERSAARN